MMIGSPASSATPGVAASVIIPTRNRSALLARAIRSSLAQTVPVEVIVLDDGSTDDTPDVMCREFPHVRYQRYEGANGPCFLRNRGSEMASSNILFPIDDDSEFVSRSTIEQTLREFDHPRVGAVGIPFINVRQDPRVWQAAPAEDGGRIYTTHAYIGAAHALRRDLFLSLGGYREHFFYMGEEGDYCIRMLNAGYVVRLGRADAVHHFESPSRNLARADFYGRRNDVLFAWHNTPISGLLPQLFMTTLKGTAFGNRVGRPVRACLGLASGYLAFLRHFRERRPVAPGAYALYRMLKDRRNVPLDEIELRLPPRSPC